VGEKHVTRQTSRFPCSAATVVSGKLAQDDMCFSFRLQVELERGAAGL
jgi:hypothetical protein